MPRTSNCAIGLLLSICFSARLANAADEGPPSLEALLQQYQALGLTLPPEEAKLVQFETNGAGIVIFNGVVQPMQYGLAFEIKAKTEKGFPLLLRGTHRWQEWDTHPQPVKATPEAARDIVLGSNDSVLDAESGLDDGLVLAIQCYARGWNDLAQELRRRIEPMLKRPPREYLIRIAWVYWENELLKPKGDWPPTARRLKQIVALDRKLDTDRNRLLIQLLDLALVPSKAKAGSIDAIIDDLIDYDGDRASSVFERDDAYWRIFTRGFDAVPALIDHLNDQRLTRCVLWRMNNSSPCHMRVCDLVSNLLQNLAASELGRNRVNCGKDGVSAAGSAKMVGNSPLGGRGGLPVEARCAGRGRCTTR